MANDNQALLSQHILRLSSALPKSVRFRVSNAIKHHETARTILDNHQALASFVAITGQEEAASALIHALMHRRYAPKLNPQNHRHEASIIACVQSLQPHFGANFLKEFRITFDFERNRIDLKIPLSNFNVKGGKDFAIRPVEPLDLVHSSPLGSAVPWVTRELIKFAEANNNDSAQQMIDEIANARNTLLYASDTAEPISKVTLLHLSRRFNISLAILIVTVMILQSKKKFPLIKDALDACFDVVQRK